ncbi:MAG: hypothetical protein R3B70_11405 [Polyangiaceae bacterium]
MTCSFTRTGSVPWSGTLKKAFPPDELRRHHAQSPCDPGRPRRLIRILRCDEGGAIWAEQREKSPFRLTGSDLYDFYFGIESTLPDEIGQMLYRYRQLASDPHRSLSRTPKCGGSSPIFRGARSILAGNRCRWKVPPLPEHLA